MALKAMVFDPFLYESQKTGGFYKPGLKRVLKIRVVYQLCVDEGYGMP